MCVLRFSCFFNFACFRMRFKKLFLDSVFISHLILNFMVVALLYYYLCVLYSILNILPFIGLYIMILTNIITFYQLNCVVSIRRLRICL